MTNAPDMSIKKHLRVFRKIAQQIIYLSFKNKGKKRIYLEQKMKPTIRFRPITFPTFQLRAFSGEN